MDNAFGSTRKSRNAAYFSLKLKYLRACEVLADPELEGRLLGAGQRAANLAGPAQERVD